jgi:hypothetical protein
MHIFVARGEITLDTSSFFLTIEYRYYVKGGRDHDAEVPRMQGDSECVQ